MSFPEENSKTGHVNKKSSAILFFALCLMIAGLAFLAYAKSMNMDIGKISLVDLLKGVQSQKSDAQGKEISEFQLDTKDHPVFSLFKDTIIRCTRDSIKGINKKGEIQWSIHISMDNPLVKVSKYGILVADIGGKDIYVLDGSDIKWNKKLDDNIINADIGDNGYVTVVHEARGYRGAVATFNLQGGRFFTRYINESNILSACVSPSGKQIVIDSVDTSGVTADTYFEFTDILGKPFAKVAKKDAILPNIKYFGDDYFVAAGDSLIVLYDKNGNEKWNQEFKNGGVYCVATALNKYIVAAVRGGNNTGIPDESTGIKVINTRGKQIAQYKLDTEVKSLKTCSNIIAANTGREVYFITTSGKLSGKYTSKNEIVSVFFSSKSEAVVFTKVSAEIVKIN